MPCARSDTLAAPLAEALGVKSLDAMRLVAQVRAQLGLDEGDLLALSGSLAEGLGNAHSDIDLLLITARPAMATGGPRDELLFLDGQLLDVQVVPMARLQRLMQRLADWAASPGARDPTVIDPAARKLLHRVRSGQALHGHAAFALLQEQLPGATLARHLIDLSRYMASTLQVDMAGFYRAADALSLHFAGQQMLGHLMDALLASHGITTGNPKWRIRQLAALDQAWEDGLYGRATGLSPQQLFLALSAFSADDQPRQAITRGAALATLARRLLPMLADGARAHPAGSGTGCTGPDDAEDRRMPQLDLDVTVKYRNGRFDLFRLNRQSSTFALGPREYAVVCLCDGVTTVAGACRQIAARWVESDAPALVEQVLALIRFGDFEMPAYVDQAALAQLIAPGAAAVRSAHPAPALPVVPASHLGYLSIE